MDNSDTIRIDDKDVDLIIDGEKYYKINRSMRGDFIKAIYLKKILQHTIKIYNRR